jgi:tRNA nucleotidyltransferase/poly(A) polymerase
MGFRAPARTLAVGAAYGVIAVLGLVGAGQVTRATLRTDAADTDGRHPAGVTFSGRPGKTRNAANSRSTVCFSVATGEVIDDVRSRADLAAGMARAIGVPAMRFGEDYLRAMVSRSGCGTRSIRRLS